MWKESLIRRVCRPLELVQMFCRIGEGEGGRKEKKGEKTLAPAGNQTLDCPVHSLGTINLSSMLNLLPT